MTEKGEFDLNLTFEAKNAGGATKAVSISDTGRLIWDESNAITMFGVPSTCTGTVYTGYKASSTPHELIPSGSTTFTATPHYQNCLWAGASVFPTTVSMNGCDYLFHLGNKFGGVSGTYAVTVDIVCPPGAEITMTTFLKAKHAENKPFCKFDIQPQNFLKGLHATYTGSGDFAITGSLRGIHVKMTSIEAGFCSNNTTTGGEIDFDLTVKGFNSLLQETAISLSE
jgi:hypothetical protein